MSQDGDPHRSPTDGVRLSPPTGALSNVRRIGEGGSAEVFAAVWRGRDVAMKVARPASFEDERDKERFLEEARRLARVKHPGVVEVLDTGELADGRPYLVMPLLEGETLADRIARGPLRLEVAVSLFTDLAESVDALHEAGLIHRDLKPGNVFLPEGEARPILLDLGIAKDVDATASTLTQAGVIRGTPAVMAPERFFGTPATVSSDVYELGVVLYAMIVGRLPWENPTNVEARLFPRLPDELEVDVPEPLVNVLMAALSTRPERRPESAGAFARDVQQAFALPGSVVREGTEKVPARSVMPQPDTPNAASIEAGRSPSPTGRSRRASRAWLAIAVLGLGGLAAATIGSGLFSRTSGVPIETPTSPSSSGFDASAIEAVLTPATSSSAPTGASVSPSASIARLAPLPSASWALPRRTRLRELVWCNQIVDEVCDPELIAINANARQACQRETARLKSVESGPRGGWEAANKNCRDRYDAVRGAASLEKSGRRDETVAAIQQSAKAAASAFPSPSPDATLDAWLQRMPACRAYAALFCSEKVRAHRGDFGCHAAKNAAYVMAKNAARYGPESIPEHNRSCQVMLNKDRATLLTEMELDETLHPAAAASSGSIRP